MVDWGSMVDWRGQGVGAHTFILIIEHERQTDTRREHVAKNKDEGRLDAESCRGGCKE